MLSFLLGVGGGGGYFLAEPCLPGVGPEPGATGCCPGGCCCPGPGCCNPTGGGGGGAVAEGGAGCVGGGASAKS